MSKTGRWTHTIMVVLGVGYLLLGGAFSRAYATCSTPPGDIDNSGLTNVVDVQCAIVSALAALNPPFIAPLCTNGVNTAPDVDCSGNPDVVDVTLVIYYALGTPLSPALDANGDKCVDACQLVGCNETLLCLNTCGGDVACESTCLALTSQKSATAAEVLADCATAAGCTESTTTQDYVDCLSTQCPAAFAVCQVDGATAALGSCCGVNTTPGCSGPACMSCVCAEDSLCCSTLWDSDCVTKAKSPKGCGAQCGCPLTCFDAVVCALECKGNVGCVDGCLQKVAPEFQDTTDALFTCLNANACFMAPDIAGFSVCRQQYCAQQSADCLEGGVPPSSTCCTKHTSPSCADGDCAGCVCQADPSCCSVAWDDACALAAGTQCNVVCHCSPLLCDEAIKCIAQCSGNETCENQCESNVVAESASSLAEVLECGQAAGCGSAQGGAAYLQCLGQHCKPEVLVCQGKPPAVLGPCCEAHDTPMCELSVCTDCVCAVDPLCCGITWDDGCVAVAGSTCNGNCVCKPLSCLDTYVCLVACGEDAGCQSACAASATPLASALAADVLQCAPLCGGGSLDEVLGCANTTCPNAYGACAGPGAPAPSGCCAPGSAPQCDDVLCAACVCATDPLCCTVMWDSECAAAALDDCKLVCDCAALDCFEAAVCAGKCGGDLSCVTGCQSKVLPSSLSAVVTLFDCLAAGDCFQGTPSAYSACAAFQCGDEVDLCLAATLPPPTTCCDVQPGKGCAVDGCETCVCTQDPVCCFIQWDQKCAKIAGTLCKNPCGCDPPGPSCMEIVDCKQACDSSECMATCQTGAVAQVVTQAETYHQCLVQHCEGQPGALSCALASCPDALWNCIK